MSILRTADLTAMLGVHRCTVWRWTKELGFPKPIQLGTRAVAWRSEDVEEWLANRPEAGS